MIVSLLEVYHLKILLTSDLFAPSVNGVVVSIMNLYKELKAAGHDVRILTLSSSDKSYIEDDFYFVRSFGVRVYPNVRATLSFNSNVINRLIDWKPDIIHSQCEFFTYTFAYRISRKTGAPIVHTYHTLYEYYTKYIIPSERIGKKMVGSLMRLRLKNAAAIIAPTLKVKKNLEQHELNEKIYVIPTGIDLEKYYVKVPESKKQEIRKTYGIPDDHKLLINIGRVAEEKNLTELIDNFNYLIKVYPKVSFLIIGDGPYRKELMNYAEKKGLTDHVHFTGMIDPKDIVSYYQVGDLFISASVSETQGLTYIEALANGLPEVCRSDDAIDGVIVSDYNGYLYNNEAEFVEQTRKLLTKDELRAEFSQNAIESSKNFSTYNFGQRVLSLYEEVLSNYSPEQHLLKLMDLVKTIRIKGNRSVK